MPTAAAIPDDLDQRWRSLARPAADNLSAERVRDWAGGQVLVAIDAAGRRHLLIRVSDPKSVRLGHPLRGLEITLRQLHPVGQVDGSWIDLAPSDDSGERPFVGLATDVIAALPGSGVANPAAIFVVIERWRRFFGRESDGLSYENQLGLIGELWFLLEWLPGLTVGGVEAWTGPLGGRHDWVTPTISVEVKTTGVSSGPVIHRIGRLDQLEEPGEGILYLLSVRAIRDASGSESLDALVERARSSATAANLDCAAILEDRLRAAGVTEADRGRYVDPVKIAQAELYRVDDEFPRLVPATFERLPAGVSDVRYSLDTSACRPWLVATKPSDIDLFHPVV